MPAPRRPAGRPPRADRPTVEVGPLDRATKADLIEEADVLALPLGRYLTAVLLGLPRSARMRAAKDGLDAS